MRLEGLPAQVARKALIVLALIAAVVLALHSLGNTDRSVDTAKGGLEAAQLAQRAAASHVAVVTTRAAEARQHTKPVFERAESLHVRVRVEGSGLIRVRDSTPAETILVPVPPLVTDRIQADSAAISALSVVLTWDSSAMAAQKQELAADAKAEGAARLTIAALERERKPRCGWRCGMLLGAVGVVALGIAAR
jgi:hypothetical protein